MKKMKYFYFNIYFYVNNLFHTFSNMKILSGIYFFAGHPVYMTFKLQYFLKPELNPLMPNVH